MSSGYVPPKRPPSITKIPQGMHIATCYLLANIGMQKVSFQGHEKLQNQVVLGWELHGTKAQDGRPLVISKTYNNTLHRSNLLDDITSWRGRSFTEEEKGVWSLEEMLGKSCQINIIHEQKGENLYAKIASITPLHDALKPPGLVNPQTTYDHKNPKGYEFNALPEWLQRKVMEAYVEAATEQYIKDDIDAASAGLPQPEAEEIGEKGYPTSWDSRK